MGQSARSFCGPRDGTANNTEEKQMPLIQVRVIKDVFNKDQKRQIINKLTDAMVSVEGENMRGVTWVTIEEVDSGDWGDRRKSLDHQRCPRAGGGQGGLIIWPLAGAQI